MRRLDMALVTHDGMSEADFSVTWTFHKSVRPRASAQATVVIFPPTGGVTRLEKWYAEKVCAAGWNAIVVKNWTGDDDLSADFDRHSRHFARVHRAFSAIAERHPGRIRLLGTSLGGLYSLSLMARLPQIERAALITVGAPFTAIVTESAHWDLTGVKKKRMREFAITTDGEYRKRIDAALGEWDDLDKLNPELGREKPVLMVIGTEDETVPARYQKELAERIQPRQTIEIANGHFWTIVKAYWSHSKAIAGFLTAED